MKKYRTQFSLIILFGFLQPVYCQKTEDFKINHNTTVRMDNYYAIFEYLYSRKNTFKPSDYLKYYWFKNYKIHSSQGDIGGRVLHGKYEAYYLSDQLKEMGVFAYGLKNGDWKSWHESGRINVLALWNNGLLSGKFLEYDKDGFLVKDFNYKKGKPKGSCLIYQDTEIINKSVFRKGIIWKETKYKNSVPVEKKKYRNGKPVNVSTYLQGKISNHQIYRNGKLHREKKYSNGIISGKKIFRKGLIFKKTTYVSGIISEEVFYENSDPVLILKYKNGELEKKTKFVDGKEITEDKQQINREKKEKRRAKPEPETDIIKDKNQPAAEKKEKKRKRNKVKDSARDMELPENN